MKTSVTTTAEFPISEKAILIQALATNQALVELGIDNEAARLWFRKFWAYLARSKALLLLEPTE